MIRKPTEQAGYLSPGRAKIAALLAGGLVAMHVLLPMDRGFPAPVLLGKPVSYSILASLLLFALYAVASTRAMSYAVSTGYCVVMTAFVAVLVQASLRAPDPVAMTAMHSTTVFFCVFVVNFAIFRYVIACGGRTILLRCGVVAMVAAAAIGIAQSLLGVAVPGYPDWYFNYYQVPMPDAALATVRAYGTLNQPILFGTALMLSIPFLFELRSMLLRYAAVGAACLAAALTGSRTILIVAAVFAAGSIVVFKLRAFVKAALVATAAVMLLQTTEFGIDLQSAARIPFLLGRLGIGSDIVASNAVDNLHIRQSASSIAMDEVFDESDPVVTALGRGRTTAAAVGAQVGRDYATVDNAFITVLYEDGIMGLFLFCAAFAVFLYESRAAARTSLHWYSAIGLLGVGMSFNFEAYSTVNVIAAASMALASASERVGAVDRPRAIMRISVVGRRASRLTPERAMILRGTEAVGLRRSRAWREAVR